MSGNRRSHENGESECRTESVPTFYRGEEVSADVMESGYFVGYEFKKNLLVVQQAVMLYCLLH